MIQTIKEDLTERFHMRYDVHTHTTFSHGKGSIEDNVKVAVEKGLSMIGIADHGPGHVTYGVKRSDFPVMRAEIDRLKPQYPNIEIKLGVEANIINPSGHLDISTDEEAILDYVLAGYHYGIFGEAPIRAAGIHVKNFWDNRWKKGKQGEPPGRGSLRQRNRNTELVIKAIHENRIWVLTHPGDKGLFDLLPIAKACEETGTLMEISTWHEAPTTDELRNLAKTEARFIISSDAHSPHRVGTFAPGLARALSAGIDPARIDNLEEK